MLFETRPDLWDKLIARDRKLFRMVNHHMDIAERTLHQKDAYGKPIHRIADFSHSLLHDRAFMLRVLTMYPDKFNVTGLMKHDMSFVVQLLEQLWDRKQQSTPRCHVHEYWHIVDHAMCLDANFMLERFYNVVRIYFQRNCGSFFSFKNLQKLAKNPLKYRELLFRAVSWNWNTFKHIPHALKTDWLFVSGLLDDARNAVTIGIRMERHTRNTCWCEKMCSLFGLALQINKTKVIQRHIDLFCEVISTLCQTMERHPASSNSRTTHESRINTLLGYYYDDDLVTTKRILISEPKAIYYLPEEFQSNETFLLEILGHNHGIYYHIPAARKSYSLLKWGVEDQNIDMRNAFKRWKAEEDYFAFFYTTHRRIMWEIFGSTVCQISPPNPKDTRPLPPELARHIISFLCGDKSSSYFARNESVQVYVPSRVYEDTWISGKIRKLKHPKYVVRLDTSHPELEGKITAYCFDIRRLEPRKLSEKRLVKISTFFEKNNAKKK